MLRIRRFVLKLKSCLNDYFCRIGANGFVECTRHFDIPKAEYVAKEITIFKKKFYESGSGEMG